MGLSSAGRWPSTSKALVAVGTLSLFVAGLALGGWIHVGQPSTSLAVTGTRVSAWMGLPDSGGAIAPLVTAPPTTVGSTPTTDLASPRPAEPPSRSANTAPAPDPDSPAARVRQALARISYPWPRLGYRIVFLGPQAGMWGRTSQRSLSTIEIYVRPDESVDMLAHVIAHEIGHAVDLTYGSDQRRSLWLQLRGISPRPWFTCSMCQDFSTPAGDFAETFAYWQMGDFDRSQLAPPPTPAQLSRLSAFFTASS